MSAVNKTIDPFVDCGNLLIIDRDPLGFDNKKDYLPSEEDLSNLTRLNTQFLVNEIWKLPRSVVEDATCADLPTLKYPLPREKPIPQKGPQTRWERFAESKGIKSKSKRGNKVWDEETESWKPRYGYHSKKNSGDNWLIEIPDNKDPNADYFQERKEAKNERVSKNQLNNLKNVKRQFNATNRNNNRDGFRSSYNNQLRGANAIPLGGGKDSRNSNKVELGHKIHNAKQATASSGKFQKKLKDEKTPKFGIKRKFEPNEKSAKSEQSKQLAILEKMGSKKPRINQSRINAAAEASFQKEGKRN